MAIVERRYNPYVFGSPVQDPAFFFGRDHELSIILNTISHALPGQRQSMAVVGPRRIGKTSLLYQVIHRLKGTAHITVLVSTEQFTPPLPLLLTQGILAALREDAERKNLPAAQVRFDLLDNPPPPEEFIFQTFRRDLKRLNDALAAQQHPPAVLLIDEVEGLTKFGDVLGFFRDLAQSFPYLLFIVAGSDRLYQLMNDSTSPFFNVFKAITVTPLGKQETRLMVREPARRAGLEFEEAAADDVVYLSGGKPYIINMICHYSTEIVLTDKDPGVTPSVIKEACRRIQIQEHGYFLSIWNEAQGLEKAILYILAGAISKSSLSLLDISCNLVEITDFEQPIIDLRDILKHLVHLQVLCEARPGYYDFTEKMFPDWLRSNLSIAQVADEARSAKETSQAPCLLDTLRLRLQVYQDNLAFIERQYLIYDPTGRNKKTSRIRAEIAQRINATEWQINDQASDDARVAKKESGFIRDLASMINHTSFQNNMFLGVLFVLLVVGLWSIIDLAVSALEFWWVALLDTTLTKHVADVIGVGVGVAGALIVTSSLGLLLIAGVTFYQLAWSGDVRPYSDSEPDEYYGSSPSHSGDITGTSTRSSGGYRRKYLNSDSSGACNKE